MPTPLASPFREPKAPAGWGMTAPPRSPSSHPWRSLPPSPSVEAATILQQGGSTDSHNARRALALGVLASPARAVQLIQASLTDQIPGLVAGEDLDVACPARGQRGHHCGTITVDPEQLLP